MKNNNIKYAIIQESEHNTLYINGARCQVTVIKDDVFKISFKDNKCFDVIYMDIWNYINSDIYKEMVTLKRKYKKYLKKDSLNTWIGCWCEREAKNNNRI